MTRAGFVIAASSVASLDGKANSLARASAMIDCIDWTISFRGKNWRRLVASVNSMSSA